MSAKGLFTVLSILTISACGGQKAPTVEAISESEVLAGLEQTPLHLAPADAHSSKIIGTSTLLPVQVDGSNVDASLRGTLAAFGLITIDKTSACTGTHLGNGYVITAGHCFFDENKKGNLKSSNTPCSNVEVQWGYRGSKDTGNKRPVVSMRSQCTQLIYAERSNEKDFALFRVSQAPSTSIAISIDSKQTTPGTKLTLFGYPEAKPLEWSQYCPLLPAPIELGFKGNSMFTYTCDTEPGNSGSTILAVTPKGGVKVVGIHDGAGPNGMDLNYATYLYDVRQTLLKNGFNLDQAVSSF